MGSASSTRMPLERVVVPISHRFFRYREKGEELE
jgi:hypothetical protein